MKMSMIMEIFKAKLNKTRILLKIIHKDYNFTLRNFFLSLSRSFIQYTSLETLNSSLVVGTLV